MKFGIGEGAADELGSCLQLYFIPFRDAWRLIRRRAPRDEDELADQQPATPAE